MEMGRNYHGLCIGITPVSKEERCHLVRMDFSLDRLVDLYVSDIVKLHGVPVSIILDRDPRFTSRF
ncbi:integrase [Gossypium australe]|uniref:Integrase n=1 Tax=Gossypium australe TaxID=47621 RepID=A0A5B6VDC9_9ROSI|nr:integrase [Gossypium australe]